MFKSMNLIKYVYQIISPWWLPIRRLLGPIDKQGEGEPEEDKSLIVRENFVRFYGQVDNKMYT